jgi:DNA excision repair protein ERCC-2
MSPLDIYPRILDFKPVVCTSIDIDLVRNSISPIIVTMAEDGVNIFKNLLFINLKLFFLKIF